MVSRAKKIKRNQLEPLLESKLYLIDRIKGETLQKIAFFLRKCDIKFGYLLDFLNYPKNYPGQKKGIILIVNKFLRDTISIHYFQIQEENLQINFVYDSIFNQIFRGKK